MFAIGDEDGTLFGGVGGGCNAGGGQGAVRWEVVRAAKWPQMPSNGNHVFNSVKNPNAVLDFVLIAKNFKMTGLIARKKILKIILPNSKSIGSVRGKKIFFTFS